MNIHELLYCRFWLQNHKTTDNVQRKIQFNLFWQSTVVSLKILTFELRNYVQNKREFEQRRGSGCQGAWGKGRSFTRNELTSYYCVSDLRSRALKWNEEWMRNYMVPSDRVWYRYFILQEKAQSDPAICWLSALVGLMIANASSYF